MGLDVGKGVSFREQKEEKRQITGTSDAKEQSWQKEGAQGKQTLE